MLSPQMVVSGVDELRCTWSIPLMRGQGNGQHFLAQKSSICGTLWWEQSYVCWCPKPQHKVLLGNSVCWRRVATL